MKRVELLAPAGNMESVYAAVQSGADAIYLGGSKFSARAYADNFDNESMEKVVKYCHLYSVKIYVTINIIIKETEFKEAIKYARFLYNIGVDALLVQDIGLAVIIKKALPDFELHASTQMTIHNLEGALFLKQLGFKRIVLSRELSIKEIEYISKNIGLETEMFIHGALCVCYSGQCLMSSMLGGRSGNRGRCAQPCRLPYNIVGSKNKVQKKGYILSTKDICTIENINEIIKTGVTSLKIEGRMKKPEYVAGVVSEYREVIDNLLNSKKSEKDIEERKRRLLQLFNREGFSKAYLFKNTGKTMMAYSFPKNAGIEIGKINDDMKILLREDISKGDGVRNNKDGFIISKIIEDGREIERAFRGYTVKILPEKYKTGNKIYKTLDLEQDKKLKKIYENPYNKKINLNLEVDFKVNKPIKLKVYYHEKTFEVTGDIVQKAIKRPVTKERICENLLKTGDTIFKFYNIEFLNYEEGFLPMASLNCIRRQIINEVEKYILYKNSNRNKSGNFKFNEKIFCGNDNDLPEKIVCITNLEQLKAALESNFEYLCINPFQRENLISLENIKDKKVYIKVPGIVKQEFNYVCDFIEKNSEIIQGLITCNLGIINKFKNKLNIIGDYKLNIYNSHSLDFYNEITDGNCISTELSKNEIKHLLNESRKSAEILVYGKVELMVSEYCAIGSTFGGKTESKKCSGACDNEKYYLVDRKNKEFVLKTDKFCRSYIYNSVPLNLIPNIPELRNMGIKSFRIDFLDENYEQAKEILDKFSKEEWKCDFSKYTRGHYKNEIE